MGAHISFVSFAAVDDIRFSLEQVWSKSNLASVVKLLTVQPSNWPRYESVVIVVDPDSFWDSVAQACSLSREHDSRILAMIWPRSGSPESFNPSRYRDTFTSNEIVDVVPLLSIDIQAAANESELDYRLLVRLANSIIHVDDISYADQLQSEMWRVYRQLVGQEPDEWELRYLERVGQYWTVRSAEVWLASPSAFFNGRRPIDVVAGHDGKQLDDLFQALDQGVS